MISSFRKLASLPHKLYKVYNSQDPPEPNARDKYLESIELSYLYSIFNLYSSVQNVPGHIVELGVGAGRNAILFGNLLRFTSQSGNSRYFGFDTFGSYTEEDLKDNPSLDPNKWKKNSYDYVLKRLKNHNLNSTCHLIPGDIRSTLPTFLNKTDHLRYSPEGFYSRLIYIDTSAYKPALLAIQLLYPTLVPGGILCVDQRKQGGEWKAIIEYCKSNGLKLIAGNNFNDVPAFIIKQ